MITLEDCKQAGSYEYKGLSTDTKPLNCAVNSLFLELDTGIFYFFNGTEWKNINERITLGESEPTGTIQITNNGIFDVHDYAEADVDVPAITPTGTMSITENGTYDVANYAEAEVDVDYATVNFNLPALTRSTPTELSEARKTLAATTVGDYALFGGGENNSSPLSTVDAYSTSLTRTTPTELSQARILLAATAVGNYALFGGGQVPNSYSTVVDAYDLNLTRITPEGLSVARDNFTATTVGNYALFGGGYSVSYRVDNVDAYDITLTRLIPRALSSPKNILAATTIGGYALFGGGWDGIVNSNVVDAYSLASYDIQIFPGTKYSFNGSTEQTSSTWQTISMQGEVVGYIKVKDATVN